MRPNTLLASTLLVALAVSVFSPRSEAKTKAAVAIVRHRVAAVRRVVVAEDIAYPIRAVEVLATSYCNRGPTFTGVPAGPGSIAVDPSVIPLGSSIFVPGYGYGVADDTGSLIKGDRIDVWLPTCAASIQWGAQDLTIDVTGSVRVEQHVGG